MKLLCSLFLLGAATVAAAAPPVVTTVPKDEQGKWTEVSASAGRLLVLTAEPASKWLLIEEADVDFHVFENGRYASFVAPANGRFRAVVSGPDGSSSRIVIVVGDSPPPPKPEPTDDLTKKLKAAYDADTGADKAEAAKDLAELYRQIAKLSADTTLVTAGDLLRKAKDTANVLIGADQLKAAREVVKGELQKVFPTDSPLTDGQRKAAETLFTKLAVVFDGIAK